VNSYFLSIYDNTQTKRLLFWHASLGEIDAEKIRYCERFLELLIDLEALLPTRRFFNTVLDDCHLVVRCKIAPLTNRSEGHLFKQVS